MAEDNFFFVFMTGLLAAFAVAAIQYGEADSHEHHLCKSVCADRYHTEEYSVNDNRCLCTKKENGQVSHLEPFPH